MSFEKGAGPSQEEREFSADKKPGEKRSRVEKIAAKAKNVGGKLLLAGALVAGVREPIFAQDRTAQSEQKEGVNFAESIDDMAEEVKSLEEFADYLYKLGGIPEGGMGQLNKDGTVTVDHLREFRILHEDLEEQLYVLKRQVTTKSDLGQSSSVKEKNALRSCLEALNSLKIKVDLFSDKSNFAEPKDP